MLLTLYCNQCDNFSCDICPVGSWNDEFNQKGCVRAVSEKDYVIYHHLFEEVYPFLKHNNNIEYKKEVYQQSVDLLNRIYECEVANELTNTGRIKS